MTNCSIVLFRVVCCKVNSLRDPRLVTLHALIQFFMDQLLNLIVVNRWLTEDYKTNRMAGILGSTGVIQQFPQHHFIYNDFCLASVSGFIKRMSLEP